MAPPFVPRRLDERSLEDLRRFFAPLGVELFEHVADRDGHRIRARFLGVETLGYSPASLSRAVLDALARMPDGVRKKVIR